MFPCMNPLMCGTLWHPASAIPICTRQHQASHALGDATAIRTSWAFDGLGDDIRSASLSIATVSIDRSPESALARMTMRSLDDVYDIAVAHSTRSAVVEMHPSRMGAPAVVHHVSFDGDGAESSGAESPWAGRLWLPDRMHFVSTVGHVDVHSIRHPSAGVDDADAAARYNNGSNWVAVAQSGYTGGLDAYAHTALAAVRKAHIGLLLARMREQVVAGVMETCGEIDSPRVATLLAQIQLIGTDFGIVAQTTVGAT